MRRGAWAAAEEAPDRPVEEPGDSLVEEHLGELAILRPRDPDSLLDERAFVHEEFLPYWAELWPSAIVLARAVAKRSLRGARTVELGCGLGAPSIAAALAGGRVLATDWSADAVRFARRNARRNGAALEAAVCAWGDPSALVARAPWDIVLAADVLYERRNVAQHVGVTELAVTEQRAKQRQQRRGDLMAGPRRGDHRPTRHLQQSLVPSCAHRILSAIPSARASSPILHRRGVRDGALRTSGG